MSNAIENLFQLGQSIWCDNLSRSMLEQGELQRLIGLGVVGVTSNPTIFMKAITGGAEYDEPFDRLLAEDRDVIGIYEGLVLADIAEAADQLKPVYERTDGVDGFVSLEVNPNLAYDTEGTIAEGRRLFAALDRPNVLIKVPATNEGVPAIKTLIGEGINVNVTLIFSLDMYDKVMRAYVDGLGILSRSGKDISRVASVASFFISRVDTAVDALLEAKRDAGADIGDLPGQAAIANARLAYAKFKHCFDASAARPFAELTAQGARVQRPLWASTSTKNPAYSSTKYTDGLIAPDTVNTLPPATIESVMNGGDVAVSIDDNVSADHACFDRLSSLGIDINAVTEKLLTDGVKIFADSYDQLLEDLTSKRSQLRTAG